MSRKLHNRPSSIRRVSVNVTDCCSLARSFHISLQPPAPPSPRAGRRRTVNAKQSVYGPAKMSINQSVVSGCLSGGGHASDVSRPRRAVNPVHSRPPPPPLRRRSLLNARRTVPSAAAYVRRPQSCIITAPVLAPGSLEVRHTSTHREPRRRPRLDAPPRSANHTATTLP